MSYTIITYIAYLVVAIPLTIWVAKTLHKNGRIFLLNNLNQKEDLTDSVNHLLVVGFYLVNIGFVTLYLKLNHLVDGLNGVFETLSTKLGTVMLMLGLMHFFNIWLFTRLGKKNQCEQRPPEFPTYKNTPVTEAVTPKL